MPTSASCQLMLNRAKRVVATVRTLLTMLVRVPLTTEETERVQRLAVEACKALHVDAYGRADFLMDEEGRIFCLEVNTLPGMTPTSFVPQEAAAVGIAYDDLCEEIVRQSMLIKRR